MPKEKSSIKEIVINVLLLAAAGGVLAWRVNDCKQKEKAAAERVEQSRKEAEDIRKKRETSCLETVAEADRNDCIKCTCTECLDDFEACHGNKTCKSLSLDKILADGGIAADDPARVAYQNRAACMLDKCGTACTQKK